MAALREALDEVEIMVDPGPASTSAALQYIAARVSVGVRQEPVQPGDAKMKEVQSLHLPHRDRREARGSA